MNDSLRMVLWNDLDNPFDCLEQSTNYLTTRQVRFIYPKWMIVIGYLPTDKSDEYPNAIVHRRKEDSLRVWTYNKENGEIGFDNPPYQPQYKVYRDPTYNDRLP